VLVAGSDTVHVGDIFTIAISIAQADSLTSFQFDLGFDPTIITVLGADDSSTDFANAALTGGGGLTGLFVGSINNAVGFDSGVANSMTTFGSPGLTPDGTLVDIEFRALSVGVSLLVLSSAFLTDGGIDLSSDAGRFALADGRVRVLPAATVPEPGSLLLLSSSLIGLLAVYRRRRARSAG
jgi:hypothetical protein